MERTRWQAGLEHHCKKRSKQKSRSPKKAAGTPTPAGPVPASRPSPLRFGVRNPGPGPTCKPNVNTRPVLTNAVYTNSPTVSSPGEDTLNSALKYITSADRPSHNLFLALAPLNVWLTVSSYLPSE
jgi:hypothetical protein